MQTVLIVIHLLVVIALVAVVLLQRSEGGALGIGGGGGFMTGRGQANALSRATAILGALFFATSLIMSIIAGWSRAPRSIIDKARLRRPARPPTRRRRDRAATCSTSSRRCRIEGRRAAPAPVAPAPAPAQDSPK